MELNGEKVDWTSDAPWTGTRKPIMSADSLPAAAYADAEFYAVEMERVFASAWVCVGFATEARQDRLLVREVAGQSIIITRTEDDAVHAFHNACRHRGTELAEQHYLDLEREAFLSLCGEEKSMARIQHMLMKNKPLRN